MSDAPSRFPLTSQVTHHLLTPEQVDSTNTLVRANAVDWDEWAVVATFSQVAGKGRLERSWVTRPGESLSASILFPRASETHRSWLPLVVGASIVSAAQAAGVSSAVVKWPNDVLVGASKLAGVLCEILPDERVIVGLGINLDFGEKTAPSPGATSVAEHAPIKPNTADELLCFVVSALKMWAATPHEEVLHVSREVVEPNLETLGRQVSVVENDGSSWNGVALFLNDRGHLIVQEVASGRMKTVVASDIVHLRQ